jgi:hypothetical protein
VSFAKLVGVALAGDPMLITSDLRPARKRRPNCTFWAPTSAPRRRHGNFYFDEFFWVHSFEELNKVASGMATHKKWRKTYFSTPSSVAHPAYPYWTGERRNRRRREDRVEIDVSRARLPLAASARTGSGGTSSTSRTPRRAAAICSTSTSCATNMPRRICQPVPVRVRRRQPVRIQVQRPDRLRLRQPGRVGGLQPEAARPYGARAVWAGYDPQESETGDNAALVIAAPPARGCALPHPRTPPAARARLRATGRVHQGGPRPLCTYRRRRGVGSGVYQLLAKPGAMPGCAVARIEYSLELKAQMIMKAQNVVRRARLAFDSSFLDIVSAFVSIKKTLTTSGRNVTFKAGRGGNDGHADLAWATMHILMNEPLDGKEKPRGTMEIIE